MLPYYTSIVLALLGRRVRYSVVRRLLLVVTNHHSEGGYWSLVIWRLGSMINDIDGI